MAESRNFVVRIFGPPSNSATSAFNSYSLVFQDQHAFEQEFAATRTRRRISGTISTHFHHGSLFERLDLTTQAIGGWWGAETPFAVWNNNPFTGAPFTTWVGAGEPSFTMTLQDFKAPSVGDTAIIAVVSNRWMVSGTPIMIDEGTYTVVGAIGPNRVQIRRLS